MSTRDEYKKALKDLHNNQDEEKRKGITHETDEYKRLNARVNELSDELPWWKR